MIATKYDETLGYIFGRCYFAGQSVTTQATMWQRVRVPSQYDEWISADMAIIQLGGNCVSLLVLYVLTATLTS